MQVGLFDEMSTYNFLYSSEQHRRAATFADQADKEKFGSIVAVLGKHSARSHYALDHSESVALPLRKVIANTFALT